MSRGKSDVEQTERTLMRNNTGTLMVSLPINQVRRLGWRSGQKLRVVRRGQTFVIQAR